MWNETSLAQLLEIKYPIIQAPMAGSATVELAAAVSNAGALGSLGCGEMNVEELEACVDELRQLTNRPFNLNFMVHSDPKFDADVDSNTRKQVAPFYKSFGIDQVPGTEQTPFSAFNREILELLLELRASVISFHFGIPPAEWIGELQQVGCKVLSSATTVAEAAILNNAGIDAIIAQGWEAGGHRGSFDVNYEDYGIGGLALIPQVVDQVDLPVIAAGGIADGRGIAACMVLGASAVQMGTAFLSCLEAGTSDKHRKAIQQAHDSDTRLTRAFSGRPARAKNNPYIESMAEQRQPLPGYPSMYNLSMPLHERSDQNEASFLLYGQAAALNRELPAADLVQTLVDETTEIFS
jgi:nitronate monooxygenase